MVSSSINNYNATGMYSLWNLNAVPGYGIYDSVLTFKAPIIVKYIIFGSAQTAQWYMPTNCDIMLYYNNVQVYHLHFDSRYYIGVTIKLETPILATSAYRNVGNNSLWQWNDGE
jgi:hypothetical protein